MLKGNRIDQIVYWGIFLVAATSMTYILVTLIDQSSREDSGFVPVGLHSS